MPTWSTATEWDGAQLREGVHDEQPAGTDWAAADKVEKGLPGSDWGNWSVPKPIAYWPLDEDSGTTANDVTGNGKDATINGPTLGDSGVLGNTAYTWDGVDDYVDANESGTGYYDTSAAWSAAGWVYFNAIPGGNQSMGFVGNRDGDGGATIAGNSGSNAPAIFYYTGSSFGTVQNSNLNISTGVWYFFAATYDTTTLRLYWADTSNATSSVSQEASNTVTIGTPSRPLYIGDEQRFTKPLDGRLSDVVWWDQEVTQTQLSSVFEAFI